MLRVAASSRPSSDGLGTTSISQKETDQIGAALDRAKPEAARVPFLRPSAMGATKEFKPSICAGQEILFASMAEQASSIQYGPVPGALHISSGI